MHAPSTDDVSLVLAAQAGDRRAVEQLVSAHLPLVYNVVGRALSGHPDVDDIVQETMFRALRELGTLRSPRSFRTWLVAIAVRQVSTHLHRRRATAKRTAPLDEAAGMPGADFEDLTILRLGLSGQRRQAALASRWLDRGDRALLSLWWLEAAGHLTRTDLAGAMGLTAPHAGVRVQRMLEQLELSRSLVAALAARPRCAGLGAVTARWDGRPSPLWRKRIGRHVRTCAACSRASEGMVPSSRLLVGLVLLPVPVALSAALIAKSALSASAAALVSSATLSGASGAALSGTGGAGVKAGLIGQLVNAVGTHPVATTIVVGALTAGVATAVAVPPQPSAPRSPAVVAAPPPRPNAPVAVALGPTSLESADEPGRFVTHLDTFGVLRRVGAASPARSRQRATFVVVDGLADARCISLRTRDGRYLRHSSWRLRVATIDGTVLFREDATFCPRAGATANSVSLESFNYRGRYLRHVGEVLWVDPSDGSAAFRGDSTFRIRPALAR
jgi:RNA polymerase sigma factor (sigma-70 family)